MGKGEVMKRKLEKYKVFQRRKGGKKEKVLFSKVNFLGKGEVGENSGALILESSTTVVTLLHGPTPS